MAAETALPMPTDAYFELVRRFPLVHIRDGGHLEAAQRMIDGLLVEELDEGGQEYLDALTDLVEVYESARVSIPEASESEVLRELMRSHGLGQAALAARVGMAQSTISAVLSGSRSLTKVQVVKLSRYFGVSPAAFLPS